MIESIIIFKNLNYIKYIEMYIFLYQLPVNFYFNITDLMNETNYVIQFFTLNIKYIINKV